MKLIWKYLKQYKKTLLGALILATINQSFSLMDPQIFRMIVDNYASKYNELTQNEFLTGVILLLLASVGVALVSRIAKNFQDYYVNVVTEKLGAKMYADSVSHSLSLPFAAFEDQRSGELLQKLEKARTDSQALVKGIVNVVFLSLIGIIFVIVYASIVHWLIGLAYFLIIPILGTTMYILSKRIKKSQEQIVKESAAMAGSTTETLRNVELVKSLGLEKQEIDRLNDTNDKILQLELQKVVLVRKLSFTQGTTINALRSILLFLMLWLIFQGFVSLGEFLSLYIYSFFIFSPLAELGTVATQYQEAKASNRLLQEILNIQPEVKPDNPQAIGQLKEILFKDVSFKYNGTKDGALKNIQISIKPGQTVAFVGPSGSGKTTMMKLLAGLYNPTSGAMKYNGTDSKQIDFESLRKRIGLVAQETQLFAGTIKENLLFVNPKATDEQCRGALESAAATPILNRGDKGLNTKIGEGGIKISGGERQRLAIARALLRNPDLLIFDEATSSLDSITEKSITTTIQEIEKSRPNLITILVAHRLSTIAHADIIYVLEKGQIVESGNHQVLLHQNGLYSALWREQQAV
ncbi:MAG: ABC transporter ATP-binding protein [bacterium]|nr:ABC transporter ATP-binding protein [bacterium]